MSDHSQAVVDIDADAQDAGHLAERLRAWLTNEGIIEADPQPYCILGQADGYPPGPRYGESLASEADALLPQRGGLSFQTGRRVFDAGGNGIELTCPACSTSFEPGPEWAEAVGAWYDGDDRASFACPTCGTAQHLVDWRGPWAWGFGHLALVFWNWPPLSDAFVQEVGTRLGHRTVLVRSRI